MKYSFAYYCSILFIIGGSYFTNAQVIKINKKELAFLVDEEDINVTFSFDGLVFNGDNISETAFLSHTEAKIIKVKNDPVASTFYALYQKSKKEDFVKAFLLELNQTITNYENTPKFSLNNLDAKYTMNINADWMYFGYNYGIVKQAAKLTTTISFHASNTPTEIISTTISNRATGSSYRERYEAEGGGIPCLRCMVNA